MSTPVARSVVLSMTFLPSGESSVVSRAMPRISGGSGLSAEEIRRAVWISCVSPPLIGTRRMSAMNASQREAYSFR